MLWRVWILINQIFQGKAPSYLRRYLWLIRRVLKSDHCEKSLIVFPMIIDQLTGQHHQYHRHAVSLSLFGHQHQPNNQLTTQLLWSKTFLASFFRLERPFTFTFAFTFTFTFTYIFTFTFTFTFTNQPPSCSDQRLSWLLSSDSKDLSPSLFRWTIILDERTKSLDNFAQNWRQKIWATVPKLGTKPRVHDVKKLFAFSSGWKRP